MTPEEFINFCECVKNAEKTGRLGSEKTYFRVIWLGYCDRRFNISNLYNDQYEEAYEFGEELSKRLK